MAIKKKSLPIIEVNNKFIDCNKVILQVMEFDQQEDSIELKALNFLEQGFTEYDCNISFRDFRIKVYEKKIKAYYPKISFK